MTTILLLPLSPKYSNELLYDSINNTFRCRYRNETENRFNMADIIVEDSHWRIVVELKPSGNKGEIRIFQTSAHENDANFNTQIFVKIVSPSGGHLTLEMSSLSTNEFYFPLNEEALKKVSVSLYTFDFLVQINESPIINEPNYSCSVTKQYSSDMVLLIEGKKLYVCVEWLSKQSKYFEQILKRMDEFEKDKDSDLPILTLHDVIYDDFMELMEIVADPEQHITVKNVEAPIEVADYLLFEKVFDKCEQFLIHDKFNYFSLCYKLLMAEVYYMPNLQEKCLEILAREEAVELRKDKFFKELSAETVNEIVDRRMQRMAQEKRIKEMQWDGVKFENFAGNYYSLAYC